MLFVIRMLQKSTKKRQAAPVRNPELLESEVNVKELRNLGEESSNEDSREEVSHQEILRELEI